MSNTNGSNIVVLNNLPLSNKYLIAVGVITAIDDVDVIVFNTVLNEPYARATVSDIDSELVVVLLNDANILVGVTDKVTVLDICLNDDSNLVGVSDKTILLITVLNEPYARATPSVKDIVLEILLNADNILSTASVRVTVLELVLLAPYTRVKVDSDIDTPPDVA